MGKITVEVYKNTFGKLTHPNILLLAVCKIAKILFYHFNEKTFPVEFHPYKFYGRFEDLQHWLSLTIESLHCYVKKLFV